MKLETKRLILRDITKKDIPALIENINNLKVSKWLSLVPYPYKLKDAKWWVDHCKKNLKKKPRESYEFVIELKSEKKQIGGIGLSHVDSFQGTAELGFWLGEKYWKQGYISEAIPKMLDFGFNKLKFRRIWAGAFKGNAASINSQKKFGFRYEGTHRKAVRAKSTGKIHDALYYALLKEKWRKK